MKFELKSDYRPTGDQPQAIDKLVKGLESGDQAQTLLGVTGSGKTFTIANVIERVQRPTIVLSHNKTLAAQLYGEFKQFFPNNKVEYFISYYDYYQPEAYIPTSDTYIEKDLSINSEIEKLRLSATSALMSGRSDVIVVASVSSIYGLGNPEAFYKSLIALKRGQYFKRGDFLNMLVEALYSRTQQNLERGKFRIKGDTVDVFPAYADTAYRIQFWDDEIEAIKQIDPDTGKTLSDEEVLNLWPANIFVTGRDQILRAIAEIERDLEIQVKQFERDHKFTEAKRIAERTRLDIEMMLELGYCSGIENYSRYFDQRDVGQRAFCLFDYFPDDYLVVIDESHVTLPQIRAMWGGDRSRKINLVEYGFRLPSALDNRPLTFQEFEQMANQTIYVSATPGDYELTQSEGVVVEQIIRPTGLLDPEVFVRPSMNQIDDLLSEIAKRTHKNERVLVTTLTKRMAEELSRYVGRLGVKCRYIHSEIDSLDRVQILRELRLGEIDVLVGVNLLREGLDLPEVSLVAIMDADKEGFLRDFRSLIQTMGRAARNANGMVIMYADKITQSMQKAIDETARRRTLQAEYNRVNGITPTTVWKSREAIIEQTKVADTLRNKKATLYTLQPENNLLAAEAQASYATPEKLEKMAKELKTKMEEAAAKQEFLEAARLRDELFEVQRLLNHK